MSITKKHFTAVAEAISAVRNDPEMFSADVDKVCDEIAERLAYYFNGENPNFDFDRFREATK